MSAQQTLIREHELIRTYLDTVALALRRLARSGSVPPAFFGDVVRFARGFVDEHPRG